MTSHIDRVATELTKRILNGQLLAGERVLEVQFSKALGVSRTPLRLALGELEKQGLLEKLATRGYRVRGFSLDEVAMALEVRGNLEGMAARLVAEAGASIETIDTLEKCVVIGRTLIDQALRSGHALDTIAWAAMNAQFHQALVVAAGNASLASALAHVGKTPMVKPGELWANGDNGVLTLSFLQRAQLDHEAVLSAVQAREGVRAEFLMREHARRSADNKRALAATLPAQIPKHAKSRVKRG